MKILLSVLLILTTLPLYSLNTLQINNLKTVYNLGKKIKASNGFSFENTLCAIMLQESSAGLELIGDKYKNGKLKSLYDSSLGIFQIKLNTAKEVIIKDKFMNKNFKHLLKNDKALVNMLLVSVQFSTLIASTYLKINYEIALKRRYKNPWKSTISRYNGGWNNTKYKSKIFKRLKYLKKLKIKGIL